MIGHLLSLQANAAAQRYGMLVDAWSSMYSEAIGAGNFGSAQQQSRVSTEAYSIARTYLDVEKNLIEEATKAVALEAHTATSVQFGKRVALDLPDAVSAHLIDANEFINREISIQIERDIAFLSNAIRQTRLQVGLAAQAQQIPMRAALIHLRISDTSGPTFFFRDRANNRWPSRKFIRSVWRLHLLSAYNETVLIDLAEAGIDQAQVHYPDPAAKFEGLIITTASNSSLPTYADIRNEIFHPNSEAVLRKIV